MGPPGTPRTSAESRPYGCHNVSIIGTSDMGPSGTPRTSAESRPYGTHIHQYHKTSDMGPPGTPRTSAESRPYGPISLNILINIHYNVVVLGAQFMH